MPFNFIERRWIWGNVRAKLTGGSPFSRKAFSIPWCCRAVRRGHKELRCLRRAPGTRGSLSPCHTGAPGWAGEGHAAARWGDAGKRAAPSLGAPRPPEAGAWAGHGPCPLLPALQRRWSPEPRPGDSLRGAEPWLESAAFFGFSPVLFADGCAGHSPSPHLLAPASLMAPPGPRPRRHSSCSQGPGTHCRYVSLSRPFQCCRVLGAPKALCEGGGVG